jgi:predicted GH43/DUF377 family glycosyl hydrolase
MLSFPTTDADLLELIRTPHKSDHLLIAPTLQEGDFDSHGVDSPFVFRHGDEYLMTYVGYDGIGYRTGLASSPDLKTWTREGLILDRGEPGSLTEFNIALTWIVRDNALFGAGRLKQYDGDYIGIYHVYPGAGYESGPAVVGLCRSHDLRNWHVEEPVFFPQDGETWEDGGLYKACLLEHEGVFYLFYNAKDKGKRWYEQTGFATSTDLKTWTRHGSNPVLPNGPSGDFDDLFASDPCVLQVGEDPDSLWAMFYFGACSLGGARDGVAFSNDLKTWRKSGEILTDIGSPGSIDETYAHKPSLFFDGETLHHFYCAVSVRDAAEVEKSAVKTAEVRGISVATSQLLS